MWAGLRWKPRWGHYPWQAWSATIRLNLACFLLSQIRFYLSFIFIFGPWTMSYCHELLIERNPSTPKAAGVIHNPGGHFWVIFTWCFPDSVSCLCSWVRQKDATAAVALWWCHFPLHQPGTLWTVDPSHQGAAVFVQYVLTRLNVL